MVAIEMVGVTKEYAGGIQAVRDLSLAVGAGECLVLAGPSGCGKTTTLRLIAGLETPSAGTIRLGNQVVDATPPWQRPVAMVFQRPALFPNRTVQRNLTLGLPRRSWWQQRTTAEAALVAELTVLLGLDAVLDRYPAELSGGQQHRVALGRALLRQAPILLLDEPLGHLDAPLRLDLRRQLHLLRRRFPATIVHVTHDAGEALALADRLAVLDCGRLLQVGTPAELLAQPAYRFVARFLQDMAMLRGQLCRKNDGWLFSAGDSCWDIPRILWFQPAPPQEVDLGVRTEGVRVNGVVEPSAATLSAQVELIERDDRRLRIVGRRGEITLTATTAADLPLRVGQEIMMQWHWTNSWIFDKDGRTAGCVPPAR